MSWIAGSRISHLLLDCEGRSHFSGTKATPSSMRSQSLKIRQITVQGTIGEHRHSSASFRHEKISTSSSRKRSTFSRAFPTSESRANPHKTKTTSCPTRNLCIRTNASAEEKSTPATRDRSTTRKRTGLFCHEDASSS